MSTGTLSHKLFRTTVEKGLAARQFRFVISSDSVDRDRDIIRLDAWNLREYEKNPVVLASHEHQRLPVGRSVDIGVRGNKLRATVEFPPVGTYDYADTVHDLVAAGFLNAASVGFRSDQAEPNGHGGLTIKKATLLEWSICAIGSNPDAMVERSAPLMMQKWLQGGTWPQTQEDTMYRDTTLEDTVARQLAALFEDQFIDKDDDPYQDPVAQAWQAMLATMHSRIPADHEYRLLMEAQLSLLGPKASIEELVQRIMRDGVVSPPKSWQNDRYLDLDDGPTFDIDEQELATAIAQVVGEATGEHVRSALNAALGRLD